MATETELSPMQAYEAKLALLRGIAADVDQDYKYAPEAGDVLADAISRWQAVHHGRAQYEERRYRTRYFCAVCYGEIPQMEDTVLRGAKSGADHVHRVCGHLYTFDMAALRKEITKQEFHHDPEAQYHEREGCPVLTDGWPTMHPKRSTFEEPR